MFDDLDHDNPPLDDDGTAIVKRRLKVLSPDGKLTIFRLLEGQLVEGNLPHGAMATAAKICCCLHSTTHKIWEAGTLAVNVSVETFSDQRTRRKGLSTILHLSMKKFLTYQGIYVKRTLVLRMNLQNLLYIVQSVL
jgi:hypothetical protein